MSRAEVTQALGITLQLIGAPPMAEPIVEAFVDALSDYPDRFVLLALRRCSRECKGRLAPQDVISRIDDGRPGPDEAWAMIPQHESGSVVWTQEMAEAYGIAAPLLREGDAIAARMAFREAYQRLVGKAREARQPARWIPSLGHDPTQRDAALVTAVERERLTVERAQALSPMIALPGHLVPQLPAPPADPKVRALLAGLVTSIGGDRG